MPKVADTATLTVGGLTWDEERITNFARNVYSAALEIARKQNKPMRLHSGNDLKGYRYTGSIQRLVTQVMPELSKVSDDSFSTITRPVYALLRSSHNAYCISKGGNGRPPVWFIAESWQNFVARTAFRTLVRDGERLDECEELSRVEYAESKVTPQEMGEGIEFPVETITVDTTFKCRFCNVPQGSSLNLARHVRTEHKSERETECLTTAAFVEQMGKDNISVSEFVKARGDVGEHSARNMLRGAVKAGLLESFNIGRNEFFRVPIVYAEIVEPVAVPVKRQEVTSVSIQGAVENLLSAIAQANSPQDDEEKKALRAENAALADKLNTAQQELARIKKTLKGLGL